MATSLIINLGSSTKKYALYDEGQVVLQVTFEKSKVGSEMCTQHAGTQQICERIKDGEFINSFEVVSEMLDKQIPRLGAGKYLDVIAIKILAPGTYFQKHAEITDAYIEKLKQCDTIAPLHVPVALREIDLIKKKYAKAKLIGVSDSAFHSDMPAKAREYSIHNDDANKFDIHRFGYYGLSAAAAARRIHPIIGIEPERMIVCHIGNGASVTALKNGTSVETSMGFSPSTGLPMGSRAGDIDATALLQLMRLKELKTIDAELYINSSGGLFGIAKESDIRTLLDRRSQNDAAATQALDVFAYHIQKEIAAQTVALGGLDVLVFTATAVERSPELRSLILQGLTHLGIQISKDRNDLLIGKEGVISVRNSKVKVVVVKTDEMGQLAHIASQF